MPPILRRFSGYLKNWKARRPHQIATNGVGFETGTFGDADQGFGKIRRLPPVARRTLDGRGKSVPRRTILHAGARLSTHAIRRDRGQLRWKFGSTQPLVVDIWSAEDPPRFRRYDLGFEVDPRVVAYSMRTPWVVFRPLAADLVNQEPDNFRLVAESKVVNGTHLVRIAKTNPQNKTVEDYWVDPTRDDLVVLWECAPPREAACSMSIESERAPEIGWIPSRWTVQLGRGESPWMVAVNTVTAFATNAEYPPDASACHFPKAPSFSTNGSRSNTPSGRTAPERTCRNSARPHLKKSMQPWATCRFRYRVAVLGRRDGLRCSANEIRVRVDQKAFRESGIDLATEVAAQRRAYRCDKCCSCFSSNLTSRSDLRSRTANW